MTIRPEFPLAIGQRDILENVSSNKLYGIVHVLSKIEFTAAETPKSFIEQSFKVGYTINLDTTFKLPYNLIKKLLDLIERAFKKFYKNEGTLYLACIESVFHFYSP